MKLYKVEFKFYSGYSNQTHAGMVEFAIIVAAADQFSALSTAWESVACLNLPEPKQFSASEVGKG